jgi:hypothetical protein
MARLNDYRLEAQCHMVLRLAQKMGRTPGRTPWSAWDAPSRILSKNEVFAIVKRPTRGSAADVGVRPTIYADARNLEN